MKKRLLFLLLLILATLSACKAQESLLDDQGGDHQAAVVHATAVA